MNFEDLREGIRSRRLTIVGAWLLVLGSVSTAAWLPTFAGRPMGTVLSTLGVGVLTGAALLRGARPRPVEMAVAGLFLSSHLVGWFSEGPSNPWIALEELLAFALLLILTADSSFRDLRGELGRLAAVTVGLHILLLGVAALVALAGYGELFFEWGHEKAAALPRFHGAARNPIGLAVPILCCAGLSRSHADARVRRLTFAGSLMLCVATLSIVTLLVPLMLLAHAKRPWARRGSTLAVVSVAFAALYVTPLSVEGPGGMRWRRAPNDAVGLHEESLSLGPALLEWRTTAYWELAVGAIECFGDHPWTGVGAGAFAHRCPVVATDTSGRDGPHRAHNFYLGMLAERGLWGAAMLILLALVFRSRFRLEGDPRRKASVWLILLTAMSKTILHMPVVVLLIATSLRRREERP